MLHMQKKKKKNFPCLPKYDGECTNASSTVQTFPVSLHCRLDPANVKIELET